SRAVAGRAACGGALRHGSHGWAWGGRTVEGATTHPATAAMVEAYAAWYDRHFDPECQDVLFAPATPARERTAWAYVLPKTSDDLIGMGRSFAKTIFLSAGNITHTPAYGHLISMGVLTAVQARNVSATQISEAMAYRALIAQTERFLTFWDGSAPVGLRVGESADE